VTGGPAGMRELGEALEKWARLAVEDGWAREWLPGAIFAREMAFFLAVCETSGVVNIVESGRQDGYSTARIGAYAELSGGRAYSIDVEADPGRAERCHRRLAGYRRLALLRGDSTGFFGPILAGDRTTPTAVLIDGPKGYLAISMLLAAGGFWNVRVGALHNLDPGSGERAYFGRLSPGPHFHEDVPGGHGGYWQKLTEEETSLCAGRQEGRPVEQSTLGVIRYPGTGRRHLVSTVSARFGAWPPIRFFLKWRLANRL
jgi:hypothetical protein